MEKSLLSARDTVGLCIKDAQGRVLSQNDRCLNICADQRGSICVEGCMAAYKLNKKKSPLELGVLHLKNINSFGTQIDALMFNDGDTITSVLFDSALVLKKQVEYLKKYNLTKAELLVVEKYLSGSRNIDTAKQLFISIGTLKTHLNNIYKKIPPAVKDVLIKIHKSKN